MSFNSKANKKQVHISCKRAWIFIQEISIKSVQSSNHQASQHEFHCSNHQSNQTSSTLTPIKQVEIYSKRVWVPVTWNKRNKFHQERNPTNSEASEREYLFKKFASRQSKVQTFKWARVKFIATTIKATKQFKTIKQVDIDIKWAWLFIQVSMKSSSNSSEHLNKRDHHQASVNSRVYTRKFYNSSKCYNQA